MITCIIYYYITHKFIGTQLVVLIISVHLVLTGCYMYRATQSYSTSSKTFLQFLDIVIAFATDIVDSHLAAMDFEFREVSIVLTIQLFTEPVQVALIN